MRVAVLGNIAHAYVVIVDCEFEVDSDVPRHLSPTSDSDGDSHGVSDPDGSRDVFTGARRGRSRHGLLTTGALAGYRTAGRRKPPAENRRRRGHPGETVGSQWCCCGDSLRVRVFRRPHHPLEGRPRAPGEGQPRLSGGCPAGCLGVSASGDADQGGEMQVLTRQHDAVEPSPLTLHRIGQDRRLRPAKAPRRRRPARRQDTGRCSAGLREALHGIHEPTVGGCRPASARVGSALVKETTVTHPPPTTARRRSPGGPGPRLGTRGSRW